MIKTFNIFEIRVKSKIDKTEHTYISLDINSLKENIKVFSEKRLFEILYIKYVLTDISIESDFEKMLEMKGADIYRLFR